MCAASVYPVSPEAAKHSLTDEAAYRAMYQQSVINPEGFWREQAARLDWIRPFSEVKRTSFDDHHVDIKWFADGTLNVSANCLDRHLAERGDQVAIIWEGDDPSEHREITYRELYQEVCKFANALRGQDVHRGDVVTIYMPMIPEAAVAMLACARIGAIHSVVFGGFSPEALAGRIIDGSSKVVITADQGIRGGRAIALKENVDEALTNPQTRCVQKIIVVRRTGADIRWHPHRDVCYDDLMRVAGEVCAPKEMGAEEPLFILYTSGSTGKPKGVLHTCGGYLLYAALTHERVFDYRPGDIYWCTADIGWITGHSYLIYGPLANGATTLMYEGVPNYPDVTRIARIIDKHRVNILYTAPTAIRAMMAEGPAAMEGADGSSLRLLGTVGEPINPEAWHWYYETVGRSRCPIVDTWWQTETGGVMITTLPGAHDMKPGSAGRPFFGICPQLVDNDGEVLDGATEGNLCITRSWPGQARTVFGDHDRFVQTYFSTYKGKYFTGDGCATRRGRLLLDHRPGGRCDQCVRPPHGYRRNRERPGGACQGGRSRGRWRAASAQGPGHLCLRDSGCRYRAQRHAAPGAAAVGPARDRSDRGAGYHPMGAGAAEDAVRQDHAPPAAQDRHGRLRRPGRYLDAGRPWRRRPVDRCP